MVIKSLQLTNFRNLEDCLVEFSPNLNILYGDNAQGKTNLLEALYFCAVSRSFKTQKEKDLIKYIGDDKKTFFKLKLALQKKYTKQEIEIKVPANGKKSVLLGGFPIKRIGDLFGELNVVFFSPDELRLIKETPSDRRRFMDIDISQVSKNYFYLLLRYEKILKSRNALLKKQADKNELKKMCAIYDIQLSDIGSKIIFSRQKFLTKLEPFARLALSYLTNEKEDLNLTYSGMIGNSVEEIKEKLNAGYTENFEHDLKFGFTSIGPHRDDIKITLNGKDIKNFASQGQMRTVALSLKLAELEILKDECGEYPVLLLDDVLSELDSTRREKLLKFTQKTQTILTCNDFPESLKNKDVKKINVRAGRLNAN